MGAETPADGVSERLGWGKAKILNVFFFPQSHGISLEQPWLLLTREGPLLV